MKDKNSNKKRAYSEQGRRVFVGLSGGVDSSVSAGILKQATPNNFEKLFGRPTPKGFRGYDVTGVFIKVWQADFLPCTWHEEMRDAMRVCAKLDIPFLMFDFSVEYKKEVVDYMISEYKAGRTPNPDVMCNKNIKFGSFFNKAMEMGADFVATGHYTRVSSIIPAKAGIQVHSGLDSRLRRNDTSFRLFESRDKNKDQSYFLWTLKQEQLKHILFPVGDIEKPEVRKLAKKYGLSTAEKKDSQGLCFIGKVDMKDFLEHFIPAKKGSVLNTRGKIIGMHEGAWFLTMGQRHGFTITEKGTDDSPLYIIAKDMEKNTITVSDKISDKEKFFSVKSVELQNVNWISGKAPEAGKKYLVRIRYRQEPQECEISYEKNGAPKIIFGAPQGGVSLGQSLVLYDGEECLGGGVISKLN